MQEFLAKSDGTLGTVFSLRTVFSCKRKNLFQLWWIQLRNVQMLNISFRKIISDDILQFTYGHRAEIIESRRKLFEQRDSYMHHLSLQRFFLHLRIFRGKIFLLFQTILYFFPKNKDQYKTQRSNIGSKQHSTFKHPFKLSSSL